MQHLTHILWPFAVKLMLMMVYWDNIYALKIQTVGKAKKRQFTKTTFKKDKVTILANWHPHLPAIQRQISSPSILFNSLTQFFTCNVNVMLRQ